MVVRKIMLMLLCFGFALSANAKVILHLNAGVGSGASTGPAWDGQTNLTPVATGIAETWNNLSSLNSAITNLQYSDGSAATGVTVTMKAGGRGYYGTSGYDSGLSPATRDSLWQNTGGDASGICSLDITGLPPRKIFDVDLYAGNTLGPPHGMKTNVLSVTDGITTNSSAEATYNELDALGVPVTLTMNADASGNLTIISACPHANSSAYFKAATLRQQPPKATVICVK